MPKETKAHDEWLETVAEPLLKHIASLYPSEEWNPEFDAGIEAIGLRQLTNGSKEEEPYAYLVKAGLHLFNESLDKSHAIAQEITNGAGSYWHGIMHRMEGDYSNAKYWLADAGHFPFHTQLAASVRSYISIHDLADLEHDALRSKLEVLITCPVWNPSVFVDAVELQATLVQQPKVEEWLKQIQRFEMELLLQYCYEQSCGGSFLEAIGQQ